MNPNTNPNKKITPGLYHYKAETIEYSFDFEVVSVADTFAVIKSNGEEFQVKLEYFVNVTKIKNGNS